VTEQLRVQSIRYHRTPRLAAGAAAMGRQETSVPLHHAMPVSIAEIDPKADGSPHDQSNNKPSDSSHAEIGREHKRYDNSPAGTPSGDGVVRVCAANVIDAEHRVTALALERTLYWEAQ
jgi:hypothetical protein